MAEAGKMVTQIIQVKYTDLNDLTTVLKPFSRMQNGNIIGLPSTQTLILRDYAENVDPRARRENCFSVSDKARAVGGGVLEAILSLGARPA